MIEFSQHAKLMLAEREIDETWARSAIEHPDGKSLGDDGNWHYVKAISAREGRILRVIINEEVEPNRVVTVFFDRRLR